jgi:WD40 repeat protein
MDLADLSRPARLLPHPAASFIVISPDGRWVATSTWHGSAVRVWDARRALPLRELPAPGKTFVAFSPDGRRMVAGGPSEFVFWDTATWNQERIVRRENAGRPGFMAFSPDGRVLAVAHSISLVRLLDSRTGRELATLESPDPQMVSWLAFSPDGSRLAVACEQRRVQLWNLRPLRRRLAEMGLDWK